MTLIEEWQALWPPLRLFITAGSSWLFFFLGSLLVDKASFCKCPAKGQEWIWKNRWISWLHAVIISVFTIYCLVICADGFIEDQMAMLTYQSHLMHFTLSFSVGYFIHDFVDNLVYTFNGSLEGIAVLAHHVVAIVMFSVFTWLDSYCCYVMLAIATEINSVFLHVRKLLQLSGFEITDRVYIVNNIINVVTFIVFRVGGQLYMKYLIVWATGYAPAILWVFGLLAMTSLQVVNMALANSLFVSDVKRWRKLQHLRRLSRSGSPESDTPIDSQGVDGPDIASSPGVNGVQHTACLDNDNQQTELKKDV